MTHIPMETNTVGACLCICAPPPPRTHTTFGIDTTNNIQCQGWGGSGKRPTTSTAQTPRECRAISRCPPFHVVVWVVGRLCLSCLTLGSLSITFLQVCFCIFKWLTSDFNQEVRTQ